MKAHTICRVTPLVPPFSCHLIHSNPVAPSITLTNISSELLSSISISSKNLSWMIITNMIEKGLEQVQDGGWSILQLVAFLNQRRYQRLNNPHASSSSLDANSPSTSLTPFIPTPVLLAGHQLALRWCMDFLTIDYRQRHQQQQSSSSSSFLHPVHRISLSQLPILLRVIRSQFHSKQSILQLTPREEQHLALQLLQAFLKGLRQPSTATTSAPTFHASNIRIQEISGSSVDHSSVFEGIILDIPLPIHQTIPDLVESSSAPAPKRAAFLKRYVRLPVILYNINLTFDSTEHFSKEVHIQQIEATATNPSLQLSLTSSTFPSSIPSSSFQSALYSRMSSLVSHWSSIGAKLVACQKVIHPYIKELCLARGILPLERLSIRHMEAMREVSQGKVLSGIDTELVRKDVLGAIGVLEERMIGRRKYLFVSPSASSSSSSPPSPPICTLLLHSLHSSQLACLTRMTQRILKHLTFLLRAPMVCAGGGATEMAMAEEIRRKVDQRRTARKIELGKMREKFKLLQQLQQQKLQLQQQHHSSLPSSSVSASSLSSQLSSLHSRLLALHCHRSPDSLIDAAALEVADGLEDLACTGRWQHRARQKSGESNSNGGYGNHELLDEIKSRLRYYYQYDRMRHDATHTASAANTSAMTNENEVPNPLLLHSPRHQHSTHDHPLFSPSLSDDDDADPSELSSNDASMSHAPTPASIPIPMPSTSSTHPTWNTALDWQLEYEAKYGIRSLTKSKTSRFECEVAPDPNSFYGYHSNNPLHPTPVYRLNSSTGSIDLDDSTILDLLFVKRAVIQIALEVTSVLLRVEQIIQNTKE